MKFRPGETNIICTDAEQSLHFYREVLGFTFQEEEQGAYRLAANGRMFLLLPFATDSSPSREYCSVAEISFDLMVDDLQRAYHYLKDHGVQFIRDWSEGKPSFIIQDPDGLAIEVIGG